MSAGRGRCRREQPARRGLGDRAQNHITTPALISLLIPTLTPTLIPHPRIPHQVSVNGRSFKRRSRVTPPTNLGAPATGGGLNLPAPIGEHTVEESPARGFRAFVDSALRLPTG